MKAPAPNVQITYKRKASLCLELFVYIPFMGKKAKQNDCADAYSDPHGGAGDLVGQSAVVEAVEDCRHDVFAVLSQVIMELLDGPTSIA